MSARASRDDSSETLFSFEVLVEYIRIDPVRNVSDSLALGLRLLDFPTLLIYPPEPEPAPTHGAPPQQTRRRTQCAFGKGKSCLFKMHLDTLRSHLGRTPLYAMVLDVKGEIPQLVGTSSISLATLVDRIKLDVDAHGVSTPSSHGGKGTVGVFTLMGEQIGGISLGYKLSSLGASSLPHVSENRITGVCDRGNLGQEACAPQTSRRDSGRVPTPKVDGSDAGENLPSDVGLHSKDTRGPHPEGSFCATTQAERVQRSRWRPPVHLEDYPDEESLSEFCPPHIIYSSSARKVETTQRVDDNVLRAELESLTLEDVCSEDGTPESEIEAPGLPVGDHSAKPLSGEKPEDIPLMPDVLGEVLGRLPLLNALLVELSQLNGRSRQQPCSIHPNLAWIYQSLPETPVRGGTKPKGQTKSLTQSRRETSLPLREINSPKNCSTPKRGAVSDRPGNKKSQEKLPVRDRSSAAQREKLKFGTTKTFCLRRKLLAPGTVRRRECAQGHTGYQTIKSENDATRKRNPMSHCDGNKKAWNRNATLDGWHSEAATSSVEPAPRKTRGPKENDEDGETSQEILEGRTNPSRPGSHAADILRTSHWVAEEPFPHVEDDGEPTGVDPGGFSFRSARSVSSGGGREEERYHDDFNSLHPSDGCSPEPAPAPSSPSPPGSPQPAPGDPCRGTFPVPITAGGSPRRSLGGARVSPPSASSDDGEGDVSASFQTVLSGNKRSDHSAESNSGSSNRRSADSASLAKGGVAAGRFSPATTTTTTTTTSSLDPQEVEEMDDQLGSLDFKNNYQHISDLVANKLPGYTL